MFLRLLQPPGWCPLHSVHSRSNSTAHPSRWLTSPLSRICLCPGQELGVSHLLYPCLGPHKTSSNLPVIGTVAFCNERPHLQLFMLFAINASPAWRFTEYGSKKCIVFHLNTLASSGTKISETRALLCWFCVFF